MNLQKRKNAIVENENESDVTYFESALQCIAYILAKCPLIVRRVRTVIRGTAGIDVTTSAKHASDACFLAS